MQVGQNVRVNAHILCLQALPIHMQKWNIRKLNKDPPTKKRVKRAKKSFCSKYGKRIIFL